MADPPRPPDKQYPVYEYDRTDPAPYRVMVQLLDDKQGTVQFNKLSFGKMMTKRDEYKHTVTNIRPLGKFKAMVFLSSFQAANQLQKDPQLKENNYKAFIPRSFVSVTGVIPGVPTDMDMEEIEQNMTCEYPIIGMARLTRYDGTRKIPSNRISVTFRASQLPKEVRLYCCLNSVRPFYSKPVLCLNCLRYNHATDNCRSRKRCPNCSSMHEGMDQGDCPNAKKCLYCKTDHRTADEACPERTRQRNIKTIMARTTLTYMEAKEQNPVFTQNRYDILENAADFPALPNSYSSMAAGGFKTKRDYRYKPQHTKRPIEEVNIADQVEIFADKKKKQAGKDSNGDANESNDGVALFNKFRVTDYERWAQRFEERRSLDIRSQLSQGKMDGTEDLSSTMNKVPINDKQTMNRSRSRSRRKDDKL